jgi:4,5:9,10-diseco-3-hydroxy-5,9,17-trioxoandrosta-1(10),2-diene-4-oate hydrolase
MRHSIPEGNYQRLSNGLRIHYTEIGQPVAGSPTVVFIHGGGPGSSAYSNYKLNLPAIVAAGHHVIAPDLPGFGLSDKPDDIDYTSTLMRESLRELLLARGVGPVVLLGNSFGGGVALEYALAHPESVRALVLVAPAGLADPATYWSQTEGGKAFLGYASEGPGDEARFRELMYLLVHTAGSINDALVSERYPIALIQPRRVFTSACIEPSWDRLHEIECPVLCFWGGDDRFIPPSHALMLMEQALDVKLVMSNGAGHWYHLELPADFNREVIDFLGGLSAAPVFRG